MNKITVLENIAKEYIKNQGINKDNVDTFLDSTVVIEELQEKVEENRGLLMNYEEYRWTYYDMIQDIVYRQVMES